MRNSLILILKPKQIVKLFIALACLLTVINLLWENFRSKPFEIEPNSEAPEIQRGEFLRWEEVDKIFGLYTNATVVDVDTGLSFRVQRRAGEYHADVQPLTARDTAIMKVIYNGQWSWQRKAIVVEVGNRRIAASMAGMPHGAGAIRGNNFDGHFCIHFRDSKVHQSGKENLAHQMMIWKAAGRFKQMLASMTPEEVIEVFFTALDQQDAGLAIKTLHKPAESEQNLLKSLVSEISRIKVQRIRPEGGRPHTYWVYLTVMYRESSNVVEKKVEIQMVNGGEKGWRVDSHGLDTLLSRKATVEIFNTRDIDEEDLCD
ncbi:hypothetical protein Desca_2437 [Desulfotomaculum nigrificans CO-1-SRB]|uniref:Uncharacterized protein n=1 Tax=Desulfotomaculum nigrificans (strain DSM 14880 / VKM B-2319 / CO-1-SRB) TaxID=868595 RepID=F6B488_DESCC|nr:hypothetical protein [Desulfotomaculum nigrificans]AEF95265.1 hypothetical protein Desca_2437 [Desulfotomaculum nigrificans CO-1-SRB]